ncbi:uncharacterized protein LOC134219980 isoform X3 [Armigeres subalbatus]|uniref:uncharacterized protein LOC134219980 isoform X3 n=1 Tax=Armigeres subalbatus TaxID=124917 RepID=UPI002ED2CF78
MADDIRNGISCMYWWYNHRVGAKESAPSVCAAWHHLHCIHDGVFLLFLVGLPQSVGVHSSSQTQTDLRGDVPATQFSGEELYDITLDSFEPYSGTDPNFIDYGTLRVSKKSRNLFVIDGKYELFQNGGDEVRIVYQIVYGSQSQPMFSGNIGFCESINGDGVVLTKLRQVSNLPPKGTCPYPKGKYYVDKYQLDESQIPPMLPPGQYTLTVQMVLSGQIKGGYKLKVTIK